MEHFASLMINFGKLRALKIWYYTFVMSSKFVSKIFFKCLANTDTRTGGDWRSNIQEKLLSYYTYKNCYILAELPSFRPPSCFAEVNTPTVVSPPILKLFHPHDFVLGQNEFELGGETTLRWGQNDWGQSDWGQNDWGQNDLGWNDRIPIGIYCIYFLNPR